MGATEQAVEGGGRQRRGQVVRLALAVGLVAGVVGLAPRPAEAETRFVPSDACGAKIVKSIRSMDQYWDCTLVDHFRTGSLDPAVWSVQTTAGSNYTLGGECQVDTPANIHFDKAPGSRYTSDYLSLTARRESSPFTCQGSSKSWPTQHTGATVMTYNKFSQAYGRFEIRANLPDVAVQGAQFSFWMYRQDREALGEIDPMEWYSAFPELGIPVLHGATGQYSNWCQLDPTKEPWHTFTLEWTPRVIRVLYDGEVCLENTSWGANQPAPFDTPATIALTIGLDPVATDTTGSLPSEWTTQIDYVKAWE